ncbi:MULTISPECIES: PspA/IM30 family protein [Pseudomonadota]|uniref:PspA/IM30 family protein n=1 Tax=Pseudomonadota TaxID=1224 RepID=UPI0040384256
MISTPTSKFCRLSLRPNAAASKAFDQILAAHARLLDWLDASVPAGHAADLVALHRSFYEAARTVSGLPARSVTLAFKDWVRRRRGETIEGLPLDEKLYSIKGIESVSIATLGGRMTIPFQVEDYGRGWNDPAPARLVKRANEFELIVSIALDTPNATVKSQEEKMLATESAVKRIGRVIAGMTNLAVDLAEGVNPDAILAQAIREIDAAADEVRVELGKAVAERHRLDVRRQQLLREKDELATKVRVAIDEDRDDLAEVGIARQVDIEAQVGVLDRLMADAEEKITQLGETVDAIAASRREAEQTRKDYQASRAAVTGEGSAATGSSGDKVSGAMTKVARAQAATTRVTGVPAAKPNNDAKALDELAELQRQREVRSRLERLKSGQDT